jgi:hypothetical protein
MNIAGAPSTPKLKRELEGTRASRHEVTLDFYAEPPHFELSLDEFEEFALARLKVSYPLYITTATSTASTRMVIRFHAITR